MQINETGEVMNLVPIPRPEDAPAVEIDMPMVAESVSAGAEGGGDPGGLVPTTNEIADDSSWTRANA